MTRQTLAQRDGLRQYIALQADNRTAGQRRADAHTWARPEHRQLAQINTPVPAPAPSWITVVLAGVCCVAVAYAVLVFALWALPIVWSVP